MADFDRTENGSEKKLATIFISKTELPEQNKTLIGFGMERPYEKSIEKNGFAEDVMVEVGAVRAFNAIENARNFLKGVGGDRQPVKIECGLDNEKHKYYTASTWIHNGVSEKTGQSYSLYKMAITLRPEIKNDAGDIIQHQERIFATKNRNGVKGYSFDSTNDKSLEAEFLANIKQGFNLGLVSEKNETLAKNPKLMEIIDQIPDRHSVTMNYDFVKQQGIVVMPETMKIVTKNIDNTLSTKNTLGADKLNSELKQDKKAKGKKGKDMDR